jgi:hypothetical protein
VDCYDADDNYTQKFDILGIKDNQFSITLFNRHHNIGTLANELGDVIFAVSRPETVMEENNLSYFKKATTRFSFHYEAYIKGERTRRPNPNDKNEYR